MVKDEKFGSRPSILEDQLKEENIDYLKDVWFITCRRKINKDPDSRYLAFIETDDKGTFEEKQYYDNIDNYFSCPLYYIYYEENGEWIIGNPENEVKMNEDEFKSFIIKKTDCRFIKGKGFAEGEGTRFSKFFRSEMGNGFALTDLDFLIFNDHLTLIEEKGYRKDEKGYLGQGQYYSFQEIQKDILENNYQWFIIFFGEDDEDVFIYEVDEDIQSYRETERVPGWGDMIPISKKKMKEIKKDEIIKEII